ncbi:MAG TPA: ATP-binding protein [Thermoleophilia bacterium]|nr:ATP-binding protein [Thermoleophilia bacterium]
MATVYSNLQLNSRVTSAATARLERSATHFGEVAGVVYVDSGGWTPAAVIELRHLVQMDALAVTLVDAGGEAVLTRPPSGPLEAGASMTAPVTADGRAIGEVTVSLADGRLLTAEELHLRDELNRMHLIAGAVSAALALAVALYLALTLSRPLRQIRAGAEAMGAGRLSTRVEERGDDEIRAVAKALNRLAETLQREEELRKESVADLAHELRTPVNGLLGRIEAAQDGVLADGTANLSAMHDEAARLTRLLDDLSSLAEAEQPGLLLTIEPVDLAALAAIQLEAFGEALREKGISASSDLHTTIVDGDPRRLEQVVINLLSNALRYTDAGGYVALAVRRQGDDALLEVADTGIGIPAADLPHVFTRFWRGEKSRSRATGGAGIGLAIVHELVRAHGGRVTLESVPGEGSVFRVLIPLGGQQPLHWLDSSGTSVLHAAAPHSR